MCKSKIQLLYTYLLIALVALVGVANRYNFVDMAASDSFVAEAVDAVALEKTELDVAELPAIAKNYSAETYQAQSTQTAKVNLPAVAKIVSSTGVDAGYDINRFHSLLYGHSTRAGGSFKNLYVGDLFTAVTEVGGARQTYRVVARKVYNVTDLTSIENAREVKTIYFYNDGITLMTCGNGRNDDSSKRLVLWAVAV